MRQRIMFFAAVLILAAAVFAQAPASAPQQAPSLVTEVQNMFNAVKGNITKSAEQFPEDKYTWQPTPQVRSWARLIAHVADDNNGACSGIIGEAAPRPAGHGGYCQFRRQQNDEGGPYEGVG